MNIYVKLLIAFFLFNGFLTYACTPEQPYKSASSDESSSSESSYERELVKSRLRNGTGMSSREAETAADAIYKFEAARKR